MADENCPCRLTLTLHFPESLVEIIQMYAHSPAREEFYSSNFENFNLCLRLNKTYADTIEELKEIPFLMDTKKSMLTNAIIVKIIPKIDVDFNTSKWIRFMFVVNNKRYFFSKCLTADLPCTDLCTVPVAKNTYCNFCFGLLNICKGSNQDALLAEITKVCKVIPVKDDFELVQRAIMAKVTDLILSIDFYSEIHR